jgi:hypothetical protein
MFDVYTIENEYRGSMDDEHKAVEFAQRHKYVVKIRRTNETIWQPESERI